MTDNRPGRHGRYVFVPLAICLLLIFIAEACTTEPDNKPPVAAFTVTPSVGTPDTVFVFDARPSEDPEEKGRYLQVRWDWDSDGVWDTLWGSVKVRQRKFDTFGTHTVALEVRDSWKSSSMATDSIRVGVVPSASFIITPFTGSVDTLFHFDASGCTHPELPADSLSVRWDWDGDGDWDTDWFVTKTENHQYTETGTYNVGLQLRDTRGLTNTAVRELRVSSHNDPPEASFTVTPTEGSIVTTFVFDASGSSDLQDSTSQLRIRWDWNSDGTWDTPFSTSKINTHQYPLEGNYTIILLVEDSDACQDTTSRSITVTNAPPVGAFTFSPSDGATTVTPILFDASTSSDEESPLADLLVRWDWESDGVWDTDWMTEKTYETNLDTEGMRTVTLGIRDPNGQSATASAQVEIDAQIFGAVKWSLAIGEVQHLCPAIDVSGNIYVSTVSQPVRAISSSGVQIWQTVESIGYYSSPVLSDDGTVYVGGTAGKIFALDESTGSVDWSFQAPPGYHAVDASAAIAADGTVYASGNNDTLYALNSDGSVKWKHRTGKYISGTPAIASDGTIYFGSRDMYIYALNPDGTRKWRYKTGGEIFSTPAIASDGTIYIGSNDTDLYAFSPDGQLLWSASMPTAVDFITPVIGSDHTIYMACKSGRLLAISAGGNNRWMIQVSNPSHNEMECTPLVCERSEGNDVIILGETDLYAYSPDGILIGYVEREASDYYPWVEGLTAGQNTVYFVSEGELIAIEALISGPASSSWPKFGKNLQNTGR